MKNTYLYLINVIICTFALSLATYAEDKDKPGFSQDSWVNTYTGDILTTNQIVQYQRLMNGDFISTVNKTVEPLSDLAACYYQCIWFGTPDDPNAVFACSIGDGGPPSIGACFLIPNTGPMACGSIPAC